MVNIVPITIGKTADNKQRLMPQVTNAHTHKRMWLYINSELLGDTFVR